MSGGEDAQGQVLVRCRRSSDEGPGALVVTGHGLSTNIIEASLEAYLVAVNKLHGAEINGVVRRVRRAADRRGPPVTGGLTYRSRRSPATASGPRSSPRRGASSTRPGAPFGFEIAWTEHPGRRRGDRRIRRRVPGRGPRPPAAPPMRSSSARSAARSGTTRRPPSAPSRPCSRSAADSGLFANLRPVTVHPALAASSPLRPELLEGVDLLIVRELTGGLYFGAGGGAGETGGERRASTRCRTPSPRSRRIVRLAFELARGRRGRLTSVDKANVLATSRLWRQVVDEVAADTRTSSSITSSSTRARCSS